MKADAHLIEELGKVPSVKDFASELDSLRQLRLLSLHDFAQRCRDLGLSIFGGRDSDLAHFRERRWLHEDLNNLDDSPRFHPFRFYTLVLLFEAVTPDIAPSAFLRRESIRKLIDLLLDKSPDDADLDQLAHQANRITDLAVLLEPIYWPRLVGHRRTRLDDAEHLSELRKYKDRIGHLIRSLDTDVWARIHERLLIQADRLDRNNELYLLLRVSSWESRERVRGNLGCALWIRHMAELIRRALEDHSDVRWREEDDTSGFSSPLIRRTYYGSERPTDDALSAKPYLAHAFGLFTGSSVRWYVEGETEYAAIRLLLGDPPRLSVEIINLRGRIEAGKDNAALKLEEWLLADIHHRRFSMISVDSDRVETVKALKGFITRGSFVGTVRLSSPDFEYANFTLAELTEVAAKFDEADGHSGGLIRGADWSEIGCAREFERKYAASTASGKRKLKGQKWGEALAKFASLEPTHPLTGELRPFLQDVRTANWGWRYDYDYFRNHLKLDQDTFQIVPRSSK